MASFCKLMTDDDDYFTSKLQIPREFVKNYGEILQSSKMMRLRSDDESGKMWRVGIEQIGNSMFFKKGWMEFAQEIGLQRHDFLTFKLVDDSAFHVSVFATTGCNPNKDCSYSEDDYDENDDDGDDEDDDDDDGDDDDDDGDDDDDFKNGEMGSNAKGRWRFSKELKSHHFHSCRMDFFPKEFAVGTGIVKKGEIILEDGKNRKWVVKLTRRNGTMYGMSCGWKRFVEANDGVIGSVVSYEFVSGNLLRAIMTNKTK